MSTFDAQTVAFGLSLLAVVLWLLWQAPKTKSLAEEERELRAYFRRVDREERERR